VKDCPEDGVYWRGSSQMKQVGSWAGEDSECWVPQAVQMRRVDGSMDGLVEVMVTADDGGNLKEGVD